jgi:hypothetical protein
MSESMPPQTRAAFSATTSRTGCRSVGELAITRRISAGRRLLLEGPRPARGSRLERLEQPDVLHWRSRLIRQRVHQGHLSLGEKTRRVARDNEGSDTPTLAQHRHIQLGSQAACLVDLAKAC